MGIRVGPSVTEIQQNVQNIQPCYNCPIDIDIKLVGMVPVRVRYKLERLATLSIISLPPTFYYLPEKNR